MKHLQGVKVSSGWDVVMAFLPDDEADSLLDRMRTLRLWAPGELSFINTDLAVHSFAGVSYYYQLVSQTENETCRWEVDDNPERSCKRGSRGTLVARRSDVSLFDGRNWRKTTTHIPDIDDLGSEEQARRPP